MRSLVSGFICALVVICSAAPAGAQPSSVKPRIFLAFDASGSTALSMVPSSQPGWTGIAIPTFGDGTTGALVGLDTDCNGLADDSRIFVAKRELRNMLLAFGDDVEWALGRFNQNQALNLSCLTINNYECNALGPYVTSYGRPTMNSGTDVPTAFCTRPPGMGAPCCPFDWEASWPAACRPVLRMWQAGDPSVCTNYQGTCTGGDVLVGFPFMGPFATQDNLDAMLRWMDGTESVVAGDLSDRTVGAFCNHDQPLVAGQRNCELRPEGPTPLAGLLSSAQSYMMPIRTADPRASCRPYSVVLITDGAETCGGNPSMTAGTLFSGGILTYVVGISIASGDRGALNSIATAGGTDAPGPDTAYFADNPTALATAFADIVRRSLRTEVCNNVDDDCDTLIDEGFQKYCNRPAGITMSTLCTDPGDPCNGVDDNCFMGIADEVRNPCGLCGPTPVEICDGLDNNCNGLVDEGGVCMGCIPDLETCDGRDNDCDMRIDEGLTRPCGSDVGECSPGIETCTVGAWGGCTAVGPRPETCNNRDDDCDGVIDGLTRSCGTTDVGVCQFGTEVCTAGSFGMCTGAIGPTPEVCDTEDDDCDTRTDEGTGGGTCGSMIGECRPGSLTCMAGALTCTGGVSPSPETCNGRDDDCDGPTDEGVPPGAACGSDVGECDPGLLRCMGGTFVCTGAVGPTDEVCDGEDDDCDTRTDEGNPGGGLPCGNDEGECMRGTSVCTGGSLMCMGGVGPMAERCNMRDDDCDTLVDEGNPDGGAACGMTDEGECDFGAEVCIAGMLECVGETGPETEICDGLDNDCDGEIDEGDPEGGMPCGDDTGECEPGTTRCDMGELVCEGGVGPMPEVCNGLDDDCDTVADDGIPVGAPCGSDEGECDPGVLVCRDGAPVCEGEIGPEDEVCNSLDDDCDTAVDEGLGLGEPCGTDEGECMAGSLRCIDGEPRCEGEIGPAPEACDCLDNDCDGRVDEGAAAGELCPSGVACVDCQCALPCMMDEFGFRCPTGRAPEVFDGTCYCVREACNDEACGEETIEIDGETRCAPDDPAVGPCVCKNNDCTFACEGVVCEGGLVCNPRDPLGRCVEDSCRGLGCPEGELCNPATGECAADPCATVDCDAGEACRDGACEPSCATVTCSAGQRCSRGVCVDDACEGVDCDPGEVCDEDGGGCITDLCADVRCPTGAVCDPGTGDCEADPCLALHCPDGEHCEDGECATDEPMMPDAGPDGGADAGPPPQPRRVLATGRGGCACEVPGATPAGGSGPGDALLFGLLVLGAALGRRRLRRAAPIVGLALAVGLLHGGCDVNPFCLDCGDAGIDAAADAAGEAGRPDTGVVDAGEDAPDDAALPDATCMEGAPELCNGFDDDCDMTVDEEVDPAMLASDPDHCGRCDNRCEPAHAFPVCTDGMCTLGDCDVGWYDIDMDPETGCEYRCTMPMPAADDSVCDLRDNDCDGRVDEDVATDTDPLHCGGCGRVCRFPHVTSARCEGGMCTFEPTDCEAGFHDIDMDPDNGCEYACTPAERAVESCNGRDDDCDGMRDEGDPGGGVACNSDTVPPAPDGDCTAGTTRCVMGAIECVGDTAPTTEICGAVAGGSGDEDCDGSVDEGNPDSGRACGSSVGTCVRGRENCVGGRLVCEGATDPVPERCDGLDNDCDTRIDEGNPGGGGACGGPTSMRGDCRPGTRNCRGGTLVCEGERLPRTEICGSAAGGSGDEDCDGTTDEGNPGGGASCGTDIGECNPGTQNCVAGSLMCVGATGTRPEICDGLDNDCDTRTDESVPAGPACGTDTGECVAGTMRCVGGTMQCVGSTGPVFESGCDGLDNDCDTRIDETTDFDNDVNNCGSCGRRCMFAGGVAACQMRMCVLVACNPGFVDADMDPATGCEYACSFSGPEVCNGRDDDCDRRTDESLTPPVGLCRTFGVCSGTTPTCGGMSGWRCMYPATFQDPEVRCDMLDNDCDGFVDEPYEPALGDPCFRGTGVCQTTGTLRCNATFDGLACSAPAPGAPRDEVCDNLDNDCDGLRDEIGTDDPGTTYLDAITTNSIPAVVVPRAGGGTTRVMAYEASRPDATLTSQGVIIDRLPCSRGAVLPWTNVLWQDAQAACCRLNSSGVCSMSGAGWRLCDASEWQTACRASTGTCTWSYGSACTTSAPLTCNGNEYDCDPVMSGDQDCLFPTGRVPGTFDTCYAGWGLLGAYDMSGNAKEWTATERGSATVHEIRGGSYTNVEAGRTCNFNFTVGDNLFSFPNTGFRCCFY